MHIVFVVIMNYGFLTLQSIHFDAHTHCNSSPSRNSIAHNKRGLCIKFSLIFQRTLLQFYVDIIAKHYYLTQLMYTDFLTNIITLEGFDWWKTKENNFFFQHLKLSLAIRDEEKRDIHSIITSNKYHLISDNTIFFAVYNNSCHIKGSIVTMFLKFIIFKYNFPTRRN